MMIHFSSGDDENIYIDTSSDDYQALVVEDPIINDRMGAFPTAQFHFNVIEPYTHLRRVKKGDYVVAFSSEEKYFAGDIDSVEFIKHENGNKELIIRAINSFYRLESLLIDKEVISACSGLRQLLERMIEIGKIKGGLQIDSNVDDSISINSIDKYPAFLLLTHLVLQKNLGFRLKNSDVLWVCTRDTYLYWSFASTPKKIITPDDPDIISLSEKQF